MNNCYYTRSEVGRYIIFSGGPNSRSSSERRFSKALPNAASNNGAAADPCRLTGSAAVG